MFRKMKKITLILITIFGFVFNIQAQQENFDSLQNNTLPSGWSAVYTNNFIGIDDYYTACSGSQYLYANIHINEVTEVTTNRDVYIGYVIPTINFKLKIMDKNTGAPFVGDFGTIEVWYSSHYSITNWVKALTINSSNFTPQNNCQSMSYYTLPTGYITSLDPFAVKFKFIHNSGDWEAIIDDYKIDLTFVASTHDLDLANLSVYPNPVSNLLNITYKENIANLKVFDLAGRLVKSLTTTNNNNSIDVSNLNSGTYLLRIETESNKVSTVKFIKQ